MIEIKPVLTANERVLNQYGRDTHLASDAVYIKEYANEVTELRAALEALQDQIAIMNDAAKYHNETIGRITDKLHAEIAAQAKEIQQWKTVLDCNEQIRVAQAKRIAELERELAEWNEFKKIRDSQMSQLRQQFGQVQKGTEP